MEPFFNILYYLLLTILIEGTVILLWKRSWEAVWFSLLINLLTNPLLNLTLMFLLGFGLGLGFLRGVLYALELIVVFVESLAYRAMLRTRFGKALWLSFVLNATSFVVGGVILEYLTVPYFER